MSVIVKGIEMPGRCDECFARHSGLAYCQIAKTSTSHTKACKPISQKVRPAWCPLVEIPTPHGRLIDADDFNGRVRVAGGFSEYDLTEDFTEGVLAALAMLKTQPTVIEEEWTKNDNDE